MSIPSSKQINQTLYTSGTLNPKKNKKQNKKNKTSNLKLQTNDSQTRCASNATNLNNRTNKIEESQKNDRSYSRQTESTSYRNSPDYQRNKIQKNDNKINPTNKSNGLKNEIAKNQNTNLNQLPPQNQRKIPLNVGFVQNQQQNQDNINSRRELAIQGANLPCAPKILPLGVLVNSASTIDRQKTQRQQYQKELELIYKKLTSANTPLTFKVNKGSFLFNKWNLQGFKSYKYQFESAVNPKKQCLWNRNSNKKSQFQLLAYSLNVDTYFENKDKRKQGKYPKVDKKQRMTLVLNQIKRLMEDGADFILLQQVTSSSFRKSLLNLLKNFNLNSNNRYIYPKNLQSKDQLLTTMILSRHQVEFGQLSFLIQNPKSQLQNLKLSQQAFCAFTVQIGQIQETVCILSSHLKSNEGNNMEYAQEIRKQQIDCIQHFGLKFNRFFSIGDMNIGDSDKFKSQNAYVQMKFHDAMNYGQSQRRGSFLFMNQNGKIIDERLDRVWIDKKSALKTQVKVQYTDVLLPSFKGLRLSREQLLVRNNGIFEYRTISDHSLMRANIIFIQ